MKRVDQVRIYGGHLSPTVRAVAGIGPWPETPKQKRERKAMEAEAAAYAKAEREAIQWVERQTREDRLAREAARLEEWRAEVGRPRRPQSATGFYSCEGLEGAFFPVGTGPWPDYRYSGLVWERSWKQPKPDDVTWSDEATTPVAWAAEPKPVSVEDELLLQGRLF